MSGYTTIKMLEEEIWLKTKRLIINECRAQGFWPEPSHLFDYMNQQAEKGQKLNKEILPGILTRSEIAYLFSESSFGVSNNALKSAIPYIAAFGYSYGELAHKLIRNDDDKIIDSGILCYLYNLTISLFDKLIDWNYKNIFLIKSVLKEQKLQQLINNHDSIFTNNIPYIRTGNIEIDIVFKIMINLIGRMRQARDNSVCPVIYKTIVNQINSSYRGEMSTFSKNLSLRQSSIYSRAKSILPFRIMGNLVLLNCCPEISNKIIVTKLFFNVGEIFWLIDDLVDFLKDLKSGQINIMTIEIIKNNPNYSGLSEGMLTAAIDGPVIPRLINRLGRNISEMILNIKTLPCNPIEKNKFKTIILMYLADGI